jgi:long-subunit acyl-CoA synthetase (AMP-forming)
VELRKLIADFPGKKNSVCIFDRGKITRHPFASLANDVAQARGALTAWGVRPGMRVGIFAPNSYQWLVYDLALIDLGVISVAFTDDFAGAVNDELLAKYHVALLLTSNSHSRQFPNRAAHIACIDADNGEIRALDRMPPLDGDEDDQHSLVFSSGSAGGLKGLVISRKGVEATLPPIQEVLDLGPGDRLQLFLPMSNFQQRNMCYLALWYDFDIIITDYTQLFAAMKALHPTILLAPPVLYQMMYAEFEKRPVWERSLLTTLGAMISWVPIAAARRAMARSVFREFHEQFGGQMRLLVTGMAPIRHNIGAFFGMIQMPLCESYGMVEAGSITYRPPGSRDYGSVGKVLDGIKLTFEADGEIIVHRENPLTLRYFQCAPGENERTFVGPGSVATGDIGKLDADGNLYLLGRKKELIVTAGGYKVHPETIEQELNNCTDVSHSVIFLKPDAAHLTCVVDLHDPTDDEARARVKKFVNTLQSTKKATQFVEVIFADTRFTKENGMLRPNLKIDRKAITARYTG